ncbi:MAG: tRNA dihydrouridine synthase DusB [Negativicutes bacterium]
MQIGALRLKNPLLLAPMAGVTDLPFRLLSKEMGCALAYSEMVSSRGLLYSNENTLDLMRIDARERPVAVQIFGSDPENMASAARIVAAAGADVVDINMGCPTPKIIKNGDGAALMRKPELAYRIMCSVAQAIDIPVTVKFRKGWDESCVNVVSLAKLAQKAGISAIAVHGRTREQFYTGKADWHIIREVKDAVTVPVIGNGDIRLPEDAKQMIDMTNCDGVMIGRSAQGNPWIFRQVDEYLKTGRYSSGPRLSERREILFRHLEMLISLKGEYLGIREMRRHAAWYTKGLPKSAQLRLRFNQAISKKDFLTIMDNFASGTAGDGEIEHEDGNNARC